MGLGGAGGSKTLAWGFAMAPYRLRILVYVISVLYLLCFRVRLFIDDLWSPAGKGLTSWLSFTWCLIVKLSLSHWYPGSGVVLDCIDS